MRKVFTIALIFCLGAIAVAGFIYVGGGNLVSSKNVDITVLGPVNIAAGDTVDLGITISNKNNAALTLTQLTIDYPEGTKDAVDSTKSLTHTKIVIGDLGAGKSITKNQQAILFGQKGDVKQIRLNVQYQVKGSVATFGKQKVYEIVIGESPITLQINKPATVTSGESFITTITISANSPGVIKNVVVRSDYPYGYNLLESTPVTTSENKNSWALGDLSSGDKKTITLKGVLIGENQDERTFRFYAGIGKGDSAELDTTLAQVSETVSLDRPAVALAILLNGENVSPYIAPAGNSINTTLTYQNNLPQSLGNPRIVVKLGGLSLDKFSIIPQNGGFYNSSDNTITWNTTNNEQLQTLAPGDRGSVSFSFSSQNNLSLNSKNPEMTIEATLMGVSQGSSDSKPLTVSEKSSVRLASQVTLSSKSLYSRGLFKNSGPLPPKAERQTTYTVVFDLVNTQNEVTGSKLTAVLGPNVKWFQASTSTEDISFDPGTNKVTWNVKTLSSGAGFAVPGRQASFQVALTPSIGQIGTVPILATNIVFTGTDDFTQKLVTVQNPPVTTRISTDPKYIQGDEQVVK